MGGRVKTTHPPFLVLHLPTSLHEAVHFKLYIPPTVTNANQSRSLIMTFLFSTCAITRIRNVYSVHLRGPLCRKNINTITETKLKLT
jgi:hypothetical protein